MGTQVIGILLLMLSGGKTGLASAAQKAQGTQMKEI